MTKRKLTKLEALQLALCYRDLGQALRLLMKRCSDLNPAVEWTGVDWRVAVASGESYHHAPTPLDAFRKAVRALIKVEKGQSQ